MSASKIMRTILVGLCLMIFTLSAHASMRVDLNGEWQFRIDKDKSGSQAGWMNKLPSDTEVVRVPHTWNLPGKYQDHEGTAWYFKTFSLPANVRNNRVELHFGATFYKARVWINGKELGAHEGGHSAYFFDVTPHLQNQNFIAVEINNQPGMDTIPALAMKLLDSKNLWYDWWHYGGIVRDVALQISDTALIRRQQIRPVLEGANFTGANVSTRVFLENYGQPRNVKLTLRAFDAANGANVGTAEKTVNLKAGASDESLTFKMANPKLWHFDNPNLYRLEVVMADAQNNPLDVQADNFGVRKVEIKNRGLYLNGERVRLTGMTRHETSPMEGLAETRGTIRYDYNDLKNLNVTLTRPVHYQQHPEILDYADRYGIMYIPEIPMWQFDEKQMTNPKVIALAEQMMREMIEQNFNHPAIFAWSVCNESSTDTPGGIAYFRRMKAMVNRLDPDRFVTFADEAFKETKTASADADFMMVNQYYGGWHGPASLLPGVLERIGRTYPNKMVIISEFGTAGVFGRNMKEVDEIRARTLTEQVAEFAKHDWIGGAILWCYQDYLSHRNLAPGTTTAYVDFGLVDENRQRRPSYFAWQKQHAPAEIKLAWIREGGNAPTGFNLALARRASNYLPSYNLRGYRVKWEVRDSNGKLYSEGTREMNVTNQPQMMTETFAQSPDARDMILSVKVMRPTGFVAAEEKIDWVRIISGGETIDDMRKKGTLPADFPTQN